MKSGLKTALSLLLTFIAFTVIAIASLSGLFSPIEKRFYEPAQVQQFRSELNEEASAGNQYFSSLFTPCRARRLCMLSDQAFRCRSLPHGPPARRPWAP